MTRVEFDDAPIGHPVVALARFLRCTEGQVYTAITAVVVAVLLAISGAHGTGTGPAPLSPPPGMRAGR